MIKCKKQRIKSLCDNILVIDPTYCGDGDMWKLPVFATRSVTIPKGTRLCQFRINRTQPPLTFIPVKHLNNTDRGGFGTSGA